jgi:hypothetical protein
MKEYLKETGAMIVIAIIVGAMIPQLSGALAILLIFRILPLILLVIGFPIHVLLSKLEGF